MRRRFLNASLLVLMLAVIGTPLVSSTTAPTVTIQEISGKLGGADYLIEIPSNWNGDLVIFCRGYSHLFSQVDMAMPVNGWKSVIMTGFAFAESNYGVGGYCVKEGIIRTHQLTEYIKNNYAVTGNIYLVGVSMGGDIALQLGAKYPDLYDGVLELCGPTDLNFQYYEKLGYANMANDQDLTAAIVANGGIVPPYPLASLSAFRAYCSDLVSDYVLACGGTPDEKPQAYERISPLYSGAVDISIPTITLHGTADALVPYWQSVSFMDEVLAAGHADLYRLYKVVGAQHANPLLLAQRPVVFQELVNWVENDIPAPPSNP